MKILIVSLLKRKVTPQMTAARPRVIYDLVCGLKKRGHAITILGTGDSHIPGVQIIPFIPKSLMEIPLFENLLYHDTVFVLKW